MHPVRHGGWSLFSPFGDDTGVFRIAHEHFSCVDSFVSLSSTMWPLSYARVNSWLNRSRLRMMVSPSVSPSSLNSSTYFTDRQWAMCRISPSPKKPFSMLLQASSNVTLVQRCYWG